MATKQMIDVFRRIFCRGRNDVFGTYYLDTGNYYVAKEPVTDDVIARHLDGKIPLGVFMLTKDTTAVAVIDVDRLDLQLVGSIVREAGKRNITGYVERSKGKGYHVWVFFSEPVPARHARQCLNSLLDAVGAKDVEVFPKQDSIHSGEFGNFVNCPLFGKLVPKGRTVFVDDHFRPFSDQWAFLKTIKQVSRQVVDSFIKDLDATPGVRPPKSRDAGKCESAEVGLRTFGLLPCAAKMLREGVPDMQRCAAFRLGVALKRAGLPFESTVSVLLDWAKKNKPVNGKGVITPEEIEHQVSSSYMKPYTGCGCNDIAVKPFCDPDCRFKRPLMRNRTGDPYAKRS